MLPVDGIVNGTGIADAEQDETIGRRGANIKYLLKTAGFGRIGNHDPEQGRAVEGIEREHGPDTGHLNHKLSRPAVARWPC